MIQFDRPADIKFHDPRNDAFRRNVEACRLAYIEGVPMEEIRLRYSRFVREEAASQVSAELRKEIERR